jgi:arsenate reductase
MTVTIWHNPKCVAQGAGDDPPALIAAMTEHPILIERPVVRSRKGTRLCRPPERGLEIL